MAQYRILKDAKKAAKQLEEEIISFGKEILTKSMPDLDKIKSLHEWEIEKDRIKSVIRSAFPSVIFNRDDLNVKHVSSHEFKNFKVENVLFNSILGWQVNASVYIPKGEGPFPAVICPTGHSSKFKENYYIPAQIFASNGYIAVSFCPPGCVGEHAYRNDHFVNGYSGWLNGMWSQTYFIADALACVDYVYSLNYCDTSNKVSITGVSGGGTTSMYTAILDDRISFLAPVCCVSDNINAQFKDLYTACPETFGKGLARHGIETTHILALFSPNRLFVVGGEQDEVFDYKVTQQVVNKLKYIYSLYGKDSNINSYFEKGTGHKYSQAMALEVLKQMNVIQKRTDIPILHNSDDIVHLEREQLSCYPSAEVNMHTINRDIALQLKKDRPVLDNEDTALVIKKILDIDNMQTKIEHTYMSPLNKVPSRWCHKFRDVILTHSNGKKIPLIHAFRDDYVKRPVFLWFGETDTWEPFNRKGPLTKIIGFLERTPIKNEHSVMSVNISGLGELDMQHTTYDAASWNRIERILTYFSVFNDRPIMAYRIRDILIAIRHAKKFSNEISIGGYGIGAISAIFAALISNEDISKVIAVSPIGSYEMIATEPSFNWPESIMMPDILKYTDLPSVLGHLGRKAVCINPKDAYMNKLESTSSDEIFDNSIVNGAKIIYDDDWENALVKEICSDD